MEGEQKDSELLFDLLEARKTYLRSLKSSVLYKKAVSDKLQSATYAPRFPDDQREHFETVNVADTSNFLSSRIAWEWGKRVEGDEFFPRTLTAQTAGSEFTRNVREFLQKSLVLAAPLHAKEWKWYIPRPPKLTAKGNLSRSQPPLPVNPTEKVHAFSQYQHLEEIGKIFKKRKNLEAVFGSDYIIEPDIVIFTEAVPAFKRPEAPVALYSPLLVDSKTGNGKPLLHASVSCKLTLRSDRAQNARTESLNLIRTRKGRAPHIAFVTAEPLPSRLASLALGTGDIDCIYHAGLYELLEAMEEVVRFGRLTLPEGKKVEESEENGQTSLGIGDGSTQEEGDGGESDEDEREEEEGETPRKLTVATLLRAQNRLNMMVKQGRLRDVSDLVLDLLL